LTRARSGQEIATRSSGTNWEIEAKGIKIDDEGIIVIECRQYTKSKLSQEQLGGLAFRIKDTGAQGGIIVSPLELQKGAKLVAAHENITHVTLAPESTTTEYVMKFLNKIFVGFHAEQKFKSSLKWM
jgi:restriction endonuclease